MLLLNGAGEDAAWEPQVRALLRAGFRVVTFTDRLKAPQESVQPPELAELVRETAATIEQLAVAPCHLAGFSLGAMIAQELALSRPDLVRSVVLIATRGRTDAFRAALIDAAIAEAEHQAIIPLAYRATTTALWMLSPRTLADGERASDWLSLFETPRRRASAAEHAAAKIDDRRAALAGVTVPCLVLSFTDDVIAPPQLGREVAEAIPGAVFHAVPDCGHLGMVERPEAVTEALLSFLRR